MNEKIILHVEIDGVMQEDITIPELKERWDVKDEKQVYFSGHIFNAEHTHAPYTIDITVARNKTADEKAPKGDSQTVEEIEQ